MFIGREKELQSLQELYDQKGFSMMVIYGRRRIGKSTLITEFIRDKKAIFYASTKVGKERNLELFTKQVLSVLAPELMNVSFSSLEDVFDFITNKLSEEKTILVIDELPYWAEKRRTEIRCRRRCRSPKRPRRLLVKTPLQTVPAELKFTRRTARRRPRGKGVCS